MPSVRLAAALLALPSLSFAAAESAASASGAAFRAAAASPAPVMRRLPRQGWMSSDGNVPQVDLVFDRVAWTVQGAVYGAPARLEIDHAARTIKGRARGGAVDLRFQWSPERVVIEDASGTRDLTLDCRWKERLVAGRVNGKPVRIEYDQAGDSVWGTAGDRVVDLSYDKVSGSLRGTLNGTPFQVKLVNLDLFDFLQNVWLFLD